MSAGRRGREKGGEHKGAPPRGGGREAGAGGSTQPRDRSQPGRAPRQAAPTDTPNYTKFGICSKTNR